MDLQSSASQKEVQNRSNPNRKVITRIPDVLRTRFAKMCATNERLECSQRQSINQLRSCLDLQGVMKCGSSISFASRILGASRWTILQNTYMPPFAIQGFGVTRAIFLGLQSAWGLGHRGPMVEVISWRSWLMYSFRTLQTPAMELHLFFLGSLRRIALPVLS